jgi:general secretion pathway protein I
VKRYLQHETWQQRSSRGLSRTARRSGISLLEVLISTAIFLGALTAILQIMRVGHESRLSARLDAEAALRCESLMGEYVSGILPLKAEAAVPFPDSGELSSSEAWQYTTEVEDGGGTSLLKVTVLVEHVVNGTQANSYFQLSRLMRDPQLFLDAAMAAEEAESDE